MPLSHVADGLLLSARQANLESVVSQLGAKTNEATAAAQEAVTQRAFVQQITKKLDVLSRRCKTLEQENTRMCEARAEMIEAEVQTEPDAVLLRAQADTEAVQESLRDSKNEGGAMAASLQAQVAREAARQLAALEVANEARRALEAQLHEATERAASAASENAAQLTAEAARAVDQVATIEIEPQAYTQTDRQTHTHTRAHTHTHAHTQHCPRRPCLFCCRSAPAFWLEARPASTPAPPTRPGSTTCRAARRSLRWRGLAERTGGAPPRGRVLAGGRARAHDLRARADRAVRSGGGGDSPPASAGAAGWVG